jgi:transposase
LLKAIGATRHDLLLAYWHIVHKQVDYAELGPDWAQRHRIPHPPTRPQLEQLGRTVTLLPTA